MTSARPDPAAVAQTRELAAFYRTRGWNPLPSRMDEKRPWLRTYKDYLTSPCPANAFGLVATTNLQLVCGVRWGLIVIDLDGPEAVKTWESWVHSRRSAKHPEFTPETWTVVNGGGGRHLWFTIPKNHPPMKKAVLWQGEGKHSAIERLCDGSLVVAPPSVHPKTGNRYRFLDRDHSPFGRLTTPAACPGWVLRLRPLVPFRGVPEKGKRGFSVLPAAPSTQPRVSAALPSDPVALAKSWGVRFTGRVRNGWAECHAVDRDDGRPSAAIHTESGFYRDLGGAGLKLSLPALGVYLHQFDSISSAVAHLRGRNARNVY